MKPDDDVDALIDALRNDWPSEQATARVRARLAALGVATGTALTASTAGASGLTAHVSVKAGLFAEALSRFAALSWGAKVGLAGVVSATAVATPVWLSSSAEAPVASNARPNATSAAPRDARAPQSKAVRALTGAIEHPPQAATNAGEPALSQAAPASLERASEPAPGLSAGRGASVGEQRSRDNAALPRPVVLENPTLPHVAAFETDGDEVPPVEPADRAAMATTLGEETLLLDSAFAALRAGDVASAEQFVREHERRFPDGLLNRERARAKAKILDIQRTETQP